MSEHSVEELERQYQSAKSRFGSARDDMRAAHERLQQAKLMATGFAGRLVRGRRWGSSPEYTFLAEKITGYNNERITGRIVKKDGTLGARVAELEIKNLIDAGEYKP